MLYAGLVQYWFSFRRDGKPLAPYAFPLAFSGTTMVCLGMFICAYLIERSTSETYFRKIKHSKLYWVQPGGQKIGDQAFNAFIGVSDSPRYISSHKLYDDSRRTVLLWAAIVLIILGFILQFVGLRAMHPSVILAQLGATLIMAVVRASLRTQRMSQKDNMLYYVDQQLVQGHELDYLALELERAQKQDLTIWAQPSRQEDILLDDGASELTQSTHTTTATPPTTPSPPMTTVPTGVGWSVIEVCQGRAAIRGIGTKVAEHDHHFESHLAASPCALSSTTTFSANRLCSRVLGARARLAQLTNENSALQWDDFPVRQVAYQLQSLIENTLDLFSTEWVEYWPQHSTYCYLPIYSVHGQHESVTNGNGAYLYLRRERDSKRWKAESSEVEAIVGLWAWSVTPSYKTFKGVTFGANVKNRRLIARSNEDANFEDAKVGYQAWTPNPVDLSTDSFKEGDATSEDQVSAFHIYRYFGWGLVPQLEEGTDEESLHRSRHLCIDQSLEHRSSKVLWAHTQNTIPTMCAQDIFISFLSALLRKVDNIGGETKLRCRNSGKDGFLLENNHLDKLVRCFEESGLGSRDDAYICIIPSLMQQSKLPLPKLTWPRVREQIDGCKEYRQFVEVDKLLRSACRYSSATMFEELTFSLGDLYIEATQDTDDGDLRRWGFAKIIKMLSKRNQPHDAQSIWSQFGWIALRIAEEKGLNETQEQLRQSGANADLVDGYEEGQSIHHWAARGNTTALRYFICRSGAKEASSLINGRSPLSIASEEGHFMAVQLLLEAGVAPSGTDTNGRTPLHSAADKGHKNVVQLLLECEINLEQGDDQEKKAIDLAAANGHVEIVQLMLDVNFDIMTYARFARDALLLAANHGQERVVQLVLELQRKINRLVGYLYNFFKAAIGEAFSGAAANGHEKVVQLMLDADMDILTEDCNTALICANDKTIIQLLLQHKADINATNKEGDTALHKAAWKGNQAAVQILLENGADITKVNQYTTKTALECAVRQGHEATVRILLEKGADADTRFGGYLGGTALHFAAFSNNKTITELLLHNKADIDATDKFGNTALHMATYKGNEVEQVLLEYGADTRRLNFYGNTALDCAALRGEGLIAEIFESAELVELGLESKLNVDFGS